MPAGNRSPIPWIHALLMILPGGCAPVEFTEADRQETRIVDLGSTFSIALPSTHEWAGPVLQGASVLFLRRDPKESGEATVFHFRAGKEGESEIVIRARPSWGEDRDFSMRVRVVEADGEIVGPSEFDDDWRGRWGRSRYGDD